MTTTRMIFLMNLHYMVMKTTTFFSVLCQKSLNSPSTRKYNSSYRENEANYLSLAERNINLSEWPQRPWWILFTLAVPLFLKSKQSVRYWQYNIKTRSFMRQHMTPWRRPKHEKRKSFRKRQVSEVLMIVFVCQRVFVHASHTRKTRKCVDATYPCEKHKHWWCEPDVN